MAWSALSPEQHPAAQVVCGRVQDVARYMLDKVGGYSLYHVCYRQYIHQSSAVGSIVRGIQFSVVSGWREHIGYAELKNEQLVVIRFDGEPSWSID